MLVRCRFVTVLLLVACCCLPTASHADVAEAKQHYNRATAAYALGRFSEAATEYEKAFDLSPDSALLYNAAQAHRIAGNKQRALLLYQNYLRIYGSEISNTDEVMRHIETLKQAIAKDESAATSPPVTPKVPASEAPAAAPGVATAQPTTTPPPAMDLTARPPERKPLVKRGWFWATVVGAAVVVAAGVTVGVVLGTPKSDPKPTFGAIAGN